MMPRPDLAITATRQYAAGAARFAALDLLRFCAALAVVVYHYKTKYIETLPADSVLATKIYAVTKFGYLGVDLFFLISGFVIFCSASGRTARQFAISRVTRLYPTMWVCMTLTALVSLWLSDSAGQVGFMQWLANATLLSEYLGYAQIDGVYWTLVVELKFYFCVFLLLATGLFRYERTWLTIWLLMTALFACCRQPFFMGALISPEYSPQFIAGITFYLLWRDGWRQSYAWLLLGAFLLSAHYAFQAIDGFAANVTPLDRWISVACIAALYLVFLSMALRRWELRPSRGLMLMGGLTYPLYLLHNRVGKEFFAGFRDQMDALLLLSLILAGILFMAWLVHVVIERRVADSLKQALMRLWQSRRSAEMT